jgi:hypothetical protein
MQGSTGTCRRTQGAPSRPDGGNILFIILIAVALFAALGFAVVERGGTSMDREQAQIATIEAEQCTLAISTGIKKLKRLNNCSESQISYELPDGSNENAQNASNTSCFLFHKDGAGLTACGSYLIASVVCAASGVEVGGSCWYYGANGGSCTDACTAVSLIYDDATRTFAGSGGTEANCQAVLDALGAPGTTVGTGAVNPSYNFGCGYDVGWTLRLRYPNSPTDANAIDPGFRRACACQ